MQTEDGQIVEPYSISAGLDYPGIGPMHAHLIQTTRAKVFPVTDEEALQAALKLTRKEGIIPALETAHAFSILDKMNVSTDSVVVINVSGRGDKDLATFQDRLDF
jgi:tryptophan synthase beta chain